MSVARMIVATCISVQLAMAFAIKGAVAAACPMTYAQFEAAVPHIDVEECPEHALGQPAFCRASAGGDLVHVFFFDTKGEQCLLKLQSYGEDAFELQINRK
mgnify:FL=1